MAKPKDENRSGAWFANDATMTWPCGYREQYKKGDPFKGALCPKHDAWESGPVVLSEGWIALTPEAADA